MTLKIEKTNALVIFSSSLSLLKFPFMVCNNCEIPSNAFKLPSSHFPNNKRNKALGLGFNSIIFWCVMKV